MERAEPGERGGGSHKVPMGARGLGATTRGVGMPSLRMVPVHPNPTMTLHPSPLPFPPQGYQWLKDKILSEEGRRQQAKLKELQAIAERLGCTLPQLAIGKGLGGWG